MATKYKQTYKQTNLQYKQTNKMPTIFLEWNISCLKKKAVKHEPWTFAVQGVFVTSGPNVLKT